MVVSIVNLLEASSIFILPDQMWLLLWKSFHNLCIIRRMNSGRQQNVFFAISLELAIKASFFAATTLSTFMPSRTPTGLEIGMIILQQEYTLFLWLSSCGLVLKETKDCCSFFNWSWVQVYSWHCRWSLLDVISSVWIWSLYCVSTYHFFLTMWVLYILPQTMFFTLAWSTWRLTIILFVIWFSQSSSESLMYLLKIS